MDQNTNPTTAPVEPVVETPAEPVTPVEEPAA